MRPYIVWSPGYAPLCGGIKVLHRFCKELEEKGQEVYLNTTDQNPIWPIKYADNAKVRELLNRGGIAVYPEIVTGNPFNAKTIVRYVLNQAGLLGGPTDYTQGETIFPFSMVFNKFGLDSSWVLFLPVIETNIFFDKHLPREGKMVYFGKGFRLGDRTRNSVTDGLPNLTSFMQTAESLSEALNKCELVYCYDNITAITEISRLCGCPVVIFPNGEFTREKYSEHEMGWDGLAWGLEEQERAISSMNSDDFMVRYLKLKETFLENLDLFIERTQNA